MYALHILYKNLESSVFRFFNISIFISNSLLTILRHIPLKYFF